jgi:hypothetical protein
VLNAEFLDKTETLTEMDTTNEEAKKEAKALEATL